MPCPISLLFINLHGSEYLVAAQLCPYGGEVGGGRGEPGERKVHGTQHVRGAVKAPGAAHTSPGRRRAPGHGHSALREHERRIPLREGRKGMGWMEFQGSEVLQMVAEPPPPPSLPR